MQRTSESLRAKGFLSILLVFQFLLTFVSCASCNTAQNPSCAGVAEFEALCCPAPSICYWANRNGAAACCPAGQNCNGAATAIYSYYTTPAVVSQVVVYSDTSTTPTYTTHLTTTTVAGIVTVTTTAGFILIGTPSSPPTQTVVIKSVGTKSQVSLLEAIVLAICTTALWLP